MQCNHIGYPACRRAGREDRCSRCGHRTGTRDSAGAWQPPVQTRMLPPWRWPAELAGRRRARRWGAEVTARQAVRP
jgi:hypothetical protein